MFLNSLRNSGSPSDAASFSYVNSSAIFADTAPSAVGRAQAQLVIRKEREMPMSKTNTHWYLRRSDARIQRRKHGWLGWQPRGKKMQGRVRVLE